MKMLFFLSAHVLMLSVSGKDVSIEQRFEQAVRFVRSSHSHDNLMLNKAMKLTFYGLYKQATVGDCNTPQPWPMKVEARAKWEAWNSYKGMTREEAMGQYIHRLQECDPSFSAV